MRHRKIAGHLRLDGVSGFNPNYPNRAIGKVFECTEPCVWQGQNKILFRRMLRTVAKPDYFLVVTRSAEVGRLDLTAGDWKSDNSLLLSFSERDRQQEAMLLVPERGLLRSELGTFILEPFASHPWTAHLLLDTRLGDKPCVTQEIRFN
jgi:hypothetical protein